MVVEALPPLRWARLSPSTCRECVLNDLPYTTGVLIGVCGLRLLRQADSTGIPGQPSFIYAKDAFGTHDDRPLNNILQFANIARPGIGPEQFHRSLIDLCEVFAHTFAQTDGQSIPATSERRLGVHEPGEPGSGRRLAGSGGPGEMSRLRRASFQIAIGCRYYADIDFNGLRAADSLEFAFLQHPQECNLSVLRQLADFVEENGPSILPVQNVRGGAASPR